MNCRGIGRSDEEVHLLYRFPARLKRTQSHSVSSCQIAAKSHHWLVVCQVMPYLDAEGW